MSGGMIRLTTLLGRVLLAAIFLVSGSGKLMDPAGTSAYMASKGIPMATFLMWGSLSFELLGALSLILGFRARIGALLLILFLIPTTLIFHNFWGLAGNERMLQMLNFLKNAAIMGGLLLVCAYGAGPLSLDARRRR